jgi:hypothetical protein
MENLFPIPGSSVCLKNSIKCYIRFGKFDLQEFRSSFEYPK